MRRGRAVMEIHTISTVEVRRRVMARSTIAISMRLEGVAGDEGVRVMVRIGVPMVGRWSIPRRLKRIMVVVQVQVRVGQHVTPIKEVMVAVQVRVGQHMMPIKVVMVVVQVSVGQGVMLIKEVMVMVVVQVRVGQRVILIKEVMVMVVVQVRVGQERVHVMLLFKKVMAMMVVLTSGRPVWGWKVAREKIRGLP